MDERARNPVDVSELDAILRERVGARDGWARLVVRCPGPPGAGDEVCRTVVHTYLAVSLGGIVVRFDRSGCEHSSPCWRAVWDQGALCQYFWNFTDNLTQWQVPEECGEAESFQ